MDNSNIKKKNFFTKYGKETIITVLSVFVLTLFLVYTSYALFTDVDIAPNANNIVVGSLVVSYDDSSAGLGGYITLSDADPLTYAEGILLTPYKFKITNDGNIKSVSTISIQDDTGAITTCGCSSNQLDHDYIKVYVVRESDGLVIGPTSLSQFEYIDRTVINPQASETYQVRIWIDDSITLNDYLNKHFHGKIVVDSSQTTSVYDYGYMNNYQLFTAPYAGNYKIEAWGAQGGDATVLSVTKLGGYGGYTSGILSLSQNDKLYIYVGESHDIIKSTNLFNGGGHGSYATTSDSINSNGGGGTDIRFFGAITPTSDQLIWNSDLGLRSRIMVAGGGGGAQVADGRAYQNVGGYGGGLTGGSGHDTQLGSTTLINAAGGSQTSGGAHAGGVYGLPASGSFGQGGNANATSGSYIYQAGGGGGYYGGGIGNALSGVVGSGAGGSSFISGHTGCVAVTSEGSAITGCTTETTNQTCSVHYSTKQFTNTVMIDGEGYIWTNTRGAQMLMPNPAGGNYGSGIGRTGNGYARISYLGS